MKQIFLPLILCYFYSAFLFAQVEPYDLTVEYMTAPVGIDTPSPRLSWKSKATDKTLKNVVQIAYQILVASSPEILADNKGDLWNSGKIVTDQSLNIEYAGKLLQTSQRCYWKVQVWYKISGNATENASSNAWSSPSSWIMGVMRSEDWKAKWIASEEKFRANYELGEAKWIWCGNATDLSVAPRGKTFFRTIFDYQPQDNAILAITADDEYKVFINGKNVTQTWGHFNDWKWMRFIDVTKNLNAGKNVIGVEVTNKSQGATGLLLRLNNLVTDSKWQSFSEPADGWNSDPNFTNEKWHSATEVGSVDCEPWGKIERRFETQSPAFAKTFRIEKKVKSATLHITGLGFYEASLNGTKIDKKVLDPAQTRYDKRVLYSTYDLTDLLKSGENRLKVLLGHGWYDVRSVAVWNFDNAPWRDFCRMIAQLEIVYSDGTKQLVASDETWDQLDSQIIFDCIRQGETATKIAEDKIIGKAIVVTAPKGKLVAEAIPPSVVTEELKPVKISEPKIGVYVIDTGQNMAGWIRLKIDGQKAGSIIQIRYGERIKSDGNIEMRPINEHYRHHVPFMPGLDAMFQVDQYRCLSGQNEIYEPRFMYHGFQYVEITGLNKAPTSETVTVCAVNNDFRSAGKFECSNELFNKIQKATLWSYRSNFVNGVPTDCPHREKNGWTGDAQLAVEQAQYNWDNTACYEKWINDLLDEQQANGNLPGIVPTSGWGYAWGNGPAWDSAIILIPFELYKYKGDKRILETAYPAMKKYVDYLTSRAKPNGLVDHGLSDWCPAKTKTDAVVTSSVYYFIDASLVASAAEILGQKEDEEKYSLLAERIRDNYLKEFFKRDGTIANGSQTAQSFPLYYSLVIDPPTFSGFLSDDQKEPTKFAFQKLIEAVGKADNHLDVGILGAKSLFHVLSRYGRTDLAMKILNQKDYPSYGSWFERGATTLWEDWGDGASRNHIMFGDISTWFYQTLGGIKNYPTVSDEQFEDYENLAKYLTVAFKCTEIKPEYPAGLDWVKAEHDSPYGLISVHWKRNGTKIELKFSVPVNTHVYYNNKKFGSGDYSYEIDAP
ncbi:MAG: glycoside hydrolase family 78 protein [Planctomycetaceae bacterium]|jgi:alpha-L-rhamnosidase|nr:glycoside hydrolase family 78 protein [Planctomycetaceae bacterium]